MDPSAIIDDLSSPHLSLSEIAARHGLTLVALAEYLATDQAQQTLDQLQSAAAVRTRLIAQFYLPAAVAALSTTPQSDRPAALSISPAHHGGPLSRPTFHRPAGGTEPAHSRRATVSPVLPTIGAIDSNSSPSRPPRQIDARTMARSTAKDDVQENLRICAGQVSPPCWPCYWSRVPFAPSGQEEKKKEDVEWGEWG